MKLVNKKGFTLIELLAVIVILAIIALIATPMILGVVETARQGSAESSALGYLDAVEKQIAINMLDGDATDDITDGVYEIADLTSKNVKVKGQIPTEGWIQIENGQIAGFSLKVGNYYVNPKDNNVNKVNADKNGAIASKPAGVSSVFAVGRAINYDPQNNVTCDNPVSTTGTKLGCMKWYVIKDNGDSVDVILDHNTTAKIEYETSGVHKEYSQSTIKGVVNTDTARWTSGLNPRLISVEEINAIVGKTNFNLSSWSDSCYYFGTLTSTYPSTEAEIARQSSFHWLFDNMISSISNGGTANDSSSYGYWTTSPMTQFNDLAANWVVNTRGEVNAFMIDKTSGDALNGDGVGIRPVITIQKSILN